HLSRQKRAKCWLAHELSHACCASLLILGEAGGERHHGAWDKAPHPSSLPGGEGIVACRAPITARTPRAIVSSAMEGMSGEALVTCSGSAGKCTKPAGISSWWVAR